MKNNSCTKICRFCLETSDSNFETIEVTCANLDFLWLKVNLSISEEPVMCGDCSKTIRTCLDFKTKCLQIEDLIVSSVKDKDGIKIDLREVYLSKISMKNINVPEDNIICRLCLELVRNNSVIFLRNSTDIVLKLEQYFPELSLTCTEDPVICAYCQVSLHCYFSFINNCLATEEKIMEYCKVEGTNGKGQVNLNSLIHFISKDFLTCKLEIDEVRIEERCNEVSENASYSVEMKKEFLHTEMDIKEESSAQESEITDEDSEENMLCRLCLKKLTENCQSIEEIFLSFLTLCPNLAISDNPMTCETCAMDLKKCFNFKVLCLSTEEYLASFAQGKNRKVDLRDNYSKVILDGNIDRFPDDHNVCRFCLELVKHDASRSVRNDVDFLAILNKYFIEIDLRITDDIIACIPCYNSIRFNVTFVNNCRDVEEKINEYCKVDGANYKDHVDLRDVATYISKSMPNLENTGSLIIKEEKHEDILSIDESVKVNFGDSADVGLLVPPFPPLKKNVIDKEVQKTNNNSFQHHPSPSQSDCVPQPKREKQPKYKCDLCDYETKRKNDLKRHMLTHETHGEIITYKCETCTFETKHKDYLQQHRRIHMDRKEVVMHKCKFCPFETKWKKDLPKHLLTHKETAVGRIYTMYKCKVCDYETKGKNDLKTHMLTHETRSGIIMYKCDGCAYETRHKGYLQQHRLIHMDRTEIVMHKCNFCPYETKWKKDLPKHLLTHKKTATKHKCDLCDYATERQSWLKRHMLTHKPPTIYKCHLCDYKTKWKFVFQKHTLVHKTHSEIIMYNCKTCDFKTRYMRCLRRHVQYNHRQVKDGDA